MPFNERYIPTWVKHACGRLITEVETMENLNSQRMGDEVVRQQNSGNQRSRNEKKDKKEEDNFSTVLREKNQHSNVQECVQPEKSGANNNASIGSEMVKQSMSREEGSVIDQSKASVDDAHQPISTGASSSTGNEAKTCPQPLVEDDNFVVDAFDEETRLRLGFAKCFKDHIYFVGDNLSCIVCDDMENKDVQSEEDFRKYYTWK